MHKSSYCGVNCEKCNAYIASVTNDDCVRQKVIDEWGKLYKRTFHIEEINCRGCKSDALFGLCAKCDIRTCNNDKDIDNCGDCELFPCERIQRFFDFHRNNETGNVFD